MRILLSGSTGLLGSRILELLERDGHEVLLLVRRKLVVSNKQIVFDFDSGAGNIYRKDLESIGLFIHCAGLAHQEKSVEMDFQLNQRVWDINYNGVVELIDKFENLKFSCDTICISSVAVYGATSGLNISADNDCRPIDSYGASKLCAETEFKKWAKVENRKCVILRPPIIIGGPPVGNLKKYVDAIQKRRYIHVTKNSEKSWVGLTDLAEFICFLTRTKYESGVFIITAKEAMKVSRLAELIADTLCIKRPLKLPDYLLNIVIVCTYIPGLMIHKNPYHWRDSIKKLQKSLTFKENVTSSFEWRPSYSLDEAVSEALIKVK